MGTGNKSEELARLRNRKQPVQPRRTGPPPDIQNMASRTGRNIPPPDSAITVDGMTNQIASARHNPRDMRYENGEINVNGFRIKRTGLDYPSNAARHAWLAIEEVIFAIEGNIQLVIGDYLNGIENEYGVTYAEVSERTRRAEKTLQNYKYVAKSVSPALRQESLTFGHCSLVAGMQSDEEKKMWLDRAAEEGWTVSRLRGEIQKMLPAKVKTAPATAEKNIGVLINDLASSIGSEAELNSVIEYLRKVFREQQQAK